MADYVGSDLRALRATQGLGQADMAARLGISVSYLSQLENDLRPLTAAVAARLVEAFPLDWSDRGLTPGRRAVSLAHLLGDPLFDGLDDPKRALKLLERQPALAERIAQLHASWRAMQERRSMDDEALADSAVAGGRLPWERIRDWFHEAGNYIHPLDMAAEALASELSGDPPREADLLAYLEARHGVTLQEAGEAAGEGILRSFDPGTRRLTLGRALPPETRRFTLANQIALLSFGTIIADIASASKLPSAEERNLLEAGLANYGASALLMPYERFRARARAFRHDIDRLRESFATSFEQTCHRLSTLQRPGALGVPFFFCRVDMAGNITKRHSATRLQFARFGGACPLWIVHEAVAIPDRVLVQLAEMPDGVRYVSMAKGLVKPSGSYARPPRRYAVALGCEAEHAGAFVYADGMDVRGTATPIGGTCRLCPRPDCDQRAFPPTERPISVDPHLRRFVPYRVL
ncbi:XRE family transcriptional regulator [Aureimonas ureilytica]|uniref:XRE family transcriptional regulator n=1 Tax=Aureimonas ureilytica TaxID=401562 RepID=A0A175RJ49_9HYPH|nr:helix-turn-helix transcriptional regulator [Aureimonas ureilytica]KTR03421.1 XRE family transcriptional regulator [Aureimonas ureilytica]